MQEDLSTIESKLECQGRFWRAKLRIVEEEYRQQITKLRADMSQRQAPPAANPEAPQNSPLKSSKPIKIPIVDSEGPPRAVPSTSPKTTPGKTIQISKTDSPAAVSNNERPIAKPRKTAPKDKLLETETKKSTAPIAVSASHHEYEEPTDINNSDHVSDYSCSEPSASEAEISELKKKDRHEKDTKAKMSQMDIIRNRLLVDLNQQMKYFGVNPDGTELPKEDMSKALRKMKQHRKGIQQVSQIMTTV